MQLRAADEGDAPAIARVHVASWQRAYRGIIDDARLDALRAEDRVPHWREWIQGEGVRVRIAHEKGAVRGSCRLSPARDLAAPPAGFAEVTHLYVSPDETATGLGHALFSDALDFARSRAYRGLLLWVLEANTPARRFYERHGLAADGARLDKPDWLGPGVFEVRYRTLL